MSSLFRFTYMSKLTSKAGLIALIAVLFAEVSTFAKNESRKQNVLYFNSYNIGLPWADSITSGVESVIRNYDDVKLYIEYLDCKRFTNPQYFNELYKFYKRKYQYKHIDAIIASDNDAVDFLQIYGDSLVPKVPILFCGINNIQDYKIDSTRFYGIREDSDVEDQLKLICRILPNTNILTHILFSS